MEPVFKAIKLLSKLTRSELEFVSKRASELALNGTHAQEVVSSSSTTKFREEAIEILQFLNAKTGQNFRAVHSQLKFIQARLASGATMEQCKGIVIFKSRQWMGTDQAKFLRPETLFNATKFESYLGEKKA